MVLKHDQRAALAGTSGMPSVLNKFVTEDDSRNSDARIPTAHKANHEDGGTDEISVEGLVGVPADVLSATEQEEKLLLYGSIIKALLSALWNDINWDDVDLEDIDWDEWRDT